MATERASAENYTIALMFPGQGSQFPGMAMDLVNANVDSRDTLALADEILGYPLSRVMKNKNRDELDQTIHTQPAIFVHSMLVWRLIERRMRLRPLIAAGHSLGEYTALCAAGALTFEDALRLVRIRAEAMNSAQSAGNCGMAAVIGISVDRIREIIESVKQDSVLDIANYNSPDQFVISGKLDALDRAKEILNKEKRSRIVNLPVSSAFHTELMKPAQEKLKSGLEGIFIAPTRFVVVANVNAVPYPDDPAEMKRLLLRQIVSPVLWEASVRRIIDLGTSRFVEIGPGKVLSGLLKRIDRSVDIVSISDWDTINNLRGTFL